MARYEITMANGYGREIDSMVIEAPSMAVALTLSGNLLLTGAVRDGEQAVSATIEELGVYECEVDESAGQEELHSVRAELHEEAALLRVAGVDLDAVARLEEFSRGLGELDCSDDPSTGTED